MDLDSIRAAGYGELADQARPALLLEAAGKHEAVGRIGGRPCLPVGSAWPRIRWPSVDAPIAFIAQLDLAALARSIWPGPAAGTLTFFCAVDPEALFVDSGGAALVLHHPPETVLEPLDEPAELEEELHSRPLFVGARAVTSLPPGDEDEEYLSLRNALMDLPSHWQPRHQLLGWPAVADDGLGPPWPALHAQAVSDGLASDDPAIDGWTVLLQVASDYDRTGMEFGDGGTLTFAIPTSDLTTGRFDRVEAITDSL